MADKFSKRYKALISASRGEDISDELVEYIVTTLCECRLPFFALAQMTAITYKTTVRGSYIDESKEIIKDGDWVELFELIELVSKNRQYSGAFDRNRFRSKVNEYLFAQGWQWQLEKGLFVFIENEELTNCVSECISKLAKAKQDTSKGEIQEAMSCLLKQPNADITGAGQHSLAALECLAREVTGDKKDTLGKLINNNPEIVPKPLNEVISKIYGYASNNARHLNEGGELGYEEAELMVFLSASLCSYLTRKNFE